MRQLLCAVLAAAPIATLSAPAFSQPPVTHASHAFDLAEADLIPETIAYDVTTSRWLISSVRQAKIIFADGKSFARTPWPVFALAIDAQRRLLWATTAVVPQCAVCSDTQHEHSALLAFNLDTGAELRRLPSPIDGVLGDMVLGPNGDVFVSEGMHGAVYRLRQGATALDRLDAPGDFHSPQTPVLSADGKTLFVPDYDRGIAALGLADRRVRWLPAAAGITVAGIDGLYMDRGWFIAVQNGTSPERIIRVSADLQKLQVLESGWPGLGESTHGVVVGRRFYFLANTGWDTFDAQGHKMPGSQPVISSVWSLPLDALP